MRTHAALSLIALGLLATGASRARQQPALPPIRQLGAVAVRSVDVFQNPQKVRGLSNGAVLMNDPSDRRLVLLDSALAHVQVVIDSSGLSGSTINAAIRSLVPYVGDSTLVLDLGPNKVIRVLDASGRIVRSEVAVPNDMNKFFSASNGGVLDALGRLVYQGPPIFRNPPDFIGDTIIATSDSVALIRWDPITKKTDTAAMLKATVTRQAMTKTDTRASYGPVIDPIPHSGDAWVGLPDGTIAVVRISDYHVDWIHPDATMTSGPKVPHAWQRITDSAKVAMMDSIRESPAILRQLRTFPADSTTADSLMLVFQANPDLLVGPDGKPRSPPPVPKRPHFIAPRDIPDFRPPFVSTGVLADAEGNIWVHPLPAPAVGAPVYEVIDRHGVLVDRIQIPRNMTLLGFCPGFAILRVQAAPGAPGAQIVKIPLH